MISYFAMVNAWSLLGSIVNGTFEEDYPLMDKSKEGWSEEDEIRELDDYYGFRFRNVGAGDTAFEDDGLDYEINSTDYMADVDDQYSHHFTSEEIYDAVWGDGIEITEEKPMAHYFKYHEEEILKDIQEYVSGTYQGHYTGKSHEYRNVQTIDLMASKELAAAFCQANILKYGSRYGNKDGKNKKDLMKVIHYAMLLLHFDNHYGEPSMPSGNFEQMP